MKHSTFLNKKDKILKRKHKDFSYDRHRITIFRSNNYFYASLIDNSNGNVLVSMSSGKVEGKFENNSQRVKALAEIFSKKIEKIELKQLYFDRSVYRYHGVVKDFVEALRTNGVKV